MSRTIRIRKGFDIRLKGKAQQIVGEAPVENRYAVKPTDFYGLKPKLLVKPDDEVKAGSPLFFDKSQPDVKFTSPVSGKVVAINRGERRRILEVEIESNQKFESEVFTKADPNTLDRQSIKKQLLDSGLWPFIMQRPFGVIANIDVDPRDIFITGFDSSPLAPDYEFILSNDLESIQTGIDALAKLTDGKVYLGLRKGSSLDSFKNVDINYFDGPHPAGNVGIQIHHTAPINKGDVVWTLNLQSVVYIGRLFETGKLRLEHLLAVVGSEVKKPQYYKAIAGCLAEPYVHEKTYGNVLERIISGNVLTGTKIESKGYVGITQNQITVIPEGNQIELFGWATPGIKKFTAGKTFLSKIFPKKEYVLNANYHGGERAFVMSEQYEKMLPMDIYPVYLIKAAILNDFDKLEQLGIYEVIEEDLALCEYACTSKIEVQQILRNGIQYMIKELS